MNGNPGIITNKNKNNNDYLEEKDFIINEIAGENNSLKSKIQMDEFMDGRVKQMANVYNYVPIIKNPSGGSKKRSRPNKRVKTKKAKAKATRKKQNKLLKKNKTLKKKNRRA